MDAVEGVACKDIFVDAHGGEGGRALEDHAYLASDFYRLHIEDVSSFEKYLASDAYVGVEVVHKVGSAEEGALAAS